MHFHNFDSNFIEVYSYVPNWWHVIIRAGNGLIPMMTSWNGNIFRVAGPLCRDFTGDRWIILTKASDAEFWCFLWSAPWINGWVKNREAGDLTRHRAHYDVNCNRRCGKLTPEPMMTLLNDAYKYHQVSKSEGVIIISWVNVMCGKTLMLIKL